MKIFIGQIYIKPGVSFPLSFHFQKWLGEELTTLAIPSEAFQHKYPGFNLGFRISAKTEIQRPEIKGPTEFKRDKDIEFTIFIPFKNSKMDPEYYRGVLQMILESIVDVLDRLNIGSQKIKDSVPNLIKHFITNPAMIETDIWRKGVSS